MKKATASVALPALRRWGRGRSADAGPAAGFVTGPVEAPEAVARGVRAWFGRGQLGPGAGVHDARGTGSRC